jgi:hypothetical protein
MRETLRPSFSINDLTPARVFVQVSDEKVRTFARENDGNRPTNPAIAACNDRPQAP